MWIALGLVISFIARVDWFEPGDFDAVTAMGYHGLMVPLLVFFYLLAVKISPLEELQGRLYAGAAVFAVVLAGPFALLNRAEGISAAAALQISGMVITDLLGVVMMVVLFRFMLKSGEVMRGKRLPIGLLLSSVTAILLAAPFGHLAGWGNDIGIARFPGVSSWLNTVGMQAQDFQEGIVASHSHLIAAALFCALTALAVLRYQKQDMPEWKKRMLQFALGLTITSLLAATVIYLVSALIGWEPPTLFVSGPQGENGVPLDDVILSSMAVGWLALIIGLRGKNEPETRSDRLTRIAVFINWTVAFVGVVLVGLYIEFHETFFGGGESPAPGAENDAAFVRAHLLLGFLLLPVVLAFLLAVAEKHRGTLKAEKGKLIFASLSIIGMLTGISGEWIWVATLDARVFIAATVIITFTILHGTIILLQ